MKLKSIFHRFRDFRWKLKKIKVYALVGKSGTGKSFRARLIMEKYGIDLMIDDGLLIRDQRILAGKSAKREKNRVTALKRAIFEYLKDAHEMKDTLEKEKFKSILLIGISEKMIARIVERLYIPYPDQIIYIEDVATEEEIIRARESRRLDGKHIIPVPVIEVKQDPSHRILDSIKIFLQNHPILFWKKQIAEKTIVQPQYSHRGNLSISEAALSQMIQHCIEEYTENDVSIKKMIFDKTRNGYNVELKLSFPLHFNIPGTLTGMQEYIIKNIEAFSGIHIETLDLTVEQIGKPKKSSKKNHKQPSRK